MKDTRQLRAGENLVGVLLLVFSLLVLREAYKISGFSSISSAGTVPMGAAVVMVLAMIGHLIDNRRKQKPDFSGFAAEMSYVTKDTFPRVLLIYVAVIFIYVVLIKPIHFMPSSFLFFLTSIILLRGASAKRAVLISIGMLASVYIIFHYVFRVLLP